MLRRLFLLSFWVLPFRAAASLWGWRVHTLGQMRCREGMTLYLILRGEVWRLSGVEREFVDSIVKTMQEFRP